MTLLKHRISAHLFQNFREFLVRNFDFDTANQAVPTYLLDQIEIAAADFAEGEGIRLIDRESLLAIKDALEMSYTDGITAITEAYLQPDDSITGKFIDKVNPKITKRLEFKLTDEELSYTLVNDQELANFSEEDWLDFAAATKPKNCKKGIPCKGSCIAVGKQCKDSSSAQKTSNKKAVTTAKKATTGKKAAVPDTSGNANQESASQSQAESQSQDDRSTKIKQHLRPQSIVHGKIHSDMLTPGSVQISPEREQFIRDHINKWGANLIPVVVRTDPKDEFKYEVISGHDIAYVAQKMGKDFVQASHYNLNDEEAAAMRDEIALLQNGGVPKTSKKKTK